MKLLFKTFILCFLALASAAAAEVEVNQRCEEGQVFCPSLGLCTEDCQDHGNPECVDCDDPDTSCPEGQQFCIDTGLCGLTCGTETRDKERRCPEGTTFCLATNSCANDCNSEFRPSLSSNIVSCPEGTTYCLDVEECQTTCGENDHVGVDVNINTECPPGTVLCLSTGTCSNSCPWSQPEDEPLREWQSCPEGTSFCISTASCSNLCQQEAIEQGPRRPRQVVPCKAGTTFCASTGTCTGSCQEEEDSGTDNQVNAEICPEGETFCLQLGQCQRDCDSEVDDDDDPEEGKKDEFVHCAPGTRFCLSTGFCQSQCEDEEQDTTETSQPCPFGTYFCLSSGTCEADCGDWNDRDRHDDPSLGQEVDHCQPGYVLCLSCGGCVPADQGRHGRDDDVTEETLFTCPVGFVFCTSIQACVVGDCAHFDSKDDTNNDFIVYCDDDEEFNLETGLCHPKTQELRPPNPSIPDKNCDDGKVYCLSTGACVTLEAEEECPGLGSCPSGTGLCSNGTCATTCSDKHSNDFKACPRPDVLPAAAFTSCQLDDHCNGDGFRCCPAADHHWRCVHVDNMTLDKAEDTLDRVCNSLADDLMLENETCSSSKSNNSESCRPGTICCQDVCRGYPGRRWPGSIHHPERPSPEEEEKEPCFQGQIFCPSSGRCQAPSDECSFKCEGNSVACKDEDGSIRCQEFSSCSSLQTLIWVAPLGQSFTVAQARPQSDPGSDFTPAVVPSFVVLDLAGFDWRLRDAPLAVGDTVQSDQELTLVTTSLAQAGPEEPFWANLTLRDQVLGRGVVTVVQLKSNNLDLALTPPLLQVKEEVIHVEANAETRMRLKELVTVTDSVQTLSQMEAAFNKVAAEMKSHGLWRYPISENNAASWIANVSSRHGGGRPVGVRLDFDVELLDGEKESGLKVKAMNDNWFAVERRNSSLDVMVDDWSQLTFIAAPTVPARIKVKVTAFAMNLNGSKQLSQDFKAVEIKVDDWNLAPVAKEPIPQKNLPIVPFEGENEGFLVSTLINSFYEDLNVEDQLGMAVVQGAKSSLGRWQYQSSGPWIDIDTPDNVDDIMDDLRQAGVWKPLKRGPMPMSAYVKALACTYLTSMTSLTLPEEADFWNQIRIRHCPDHAAALQSSSNLRAMSSGRRRTRVAALQQDGLALALDNLTQVTTTAAAASEKPQDRMEMLNEALKTKLVSALLLGPLDRLRFQPFQPDDVWNVLEAINTTKLIFTAWDQSDNGTSGSWTNFSMPFCSNGICGARRALAMDVATYYIEKSDCNGAPIIQEPLKVDECGVCGGQNSCLDCQGQLNREFVSECGQCRPKAGPSLKNCAGFCGTGFDWVSAPGGSRVCLPTGSNGTRPSCDGQTNSTAFVNRCGVCVEGSTGLANDTGLDQCGLCKAADDDNEARDCPCFQHRDACDVCRMKNAADWNDCPDTEKVLNIEPKIVDKISGDIVEVRLTRETGINKADYKDLICQTGNPGVQVATSLVRPGFFKLTLTNPPSGLYNFSCQVKIKDVASAQRTGHNQKLVIVDSRTVEVTEVTAKEVGPNSTEDKSHEIHVRLSRGVESFEEAGLTCFCRQVGKVKARALPQARLDSTDRSQVNCGSVFLPRGQEYECGIVFSFQPRIFRRHTLPAKTIVIRNPAPKLTSAVRRRNGNIAIAFNTRVEGPDTCQDIFEANTINSLGTEVTCRFRAKRLVVSPVADSSNVTDLTFKTGNGIRVKGSTSPLFADELQARSVALNLTTSEQDGDEDDEASTKPSFLLVGRSQVCFGTNVKLRVKALRNIGEAGDQIAWQVFRLSREGREDQNEAEPVLEGTMDFGKDQKNGKALNEGQDQEKRPPKRGKGRRGQRSIVIKSTELEPDVQYELRAVGVLAAKTNVTDQVVIPFKMAGQDQRVVVNIRKPRGARFADQSLSLEAKIKICPDATSKCSNQVGTAGNGTQSCQENDEVEDPVGERKTESRFKYFWSADGPTGSMDMSIQDSKAITFPRGSLEGGRIYRFTVNVAPEDNPNDFASGMTDVVISSRGVKAKLPTKMMTVGTQSDIRLDGSLSTDLDNKPGSLKFEWVCLTEESSEPCKVYSDDQDMKLLADQFQEELSQARVTIPKGTLAAGTYNFTLCVSKGSSLSCQSLRVFVRSGRVASFHLAAKDTKADPNQEIVIKALVDGSDGTCVNWESVNVEGHAYIDLALHSKSSEPECFQSSEDSQRGFHLVIPPKILEGDSRYQFRIIGRNPDYGSSEASVVLETLPVPQSGLCEVSPTSGQAMNTTFEISCSGFLPEDEELRYTFFYSTNGTEKFFLSEAHAVDDLSVEVHLPAGKVRILAEVCNAYQVCVKDIMVSDNIDVELGDFGSDNIIELGEGAERLIYEKSYLEAVSCMKRTTSTVQRSAENWQIYQIPLCSLVFKIFTEVAEALQSHLQRTDINVASEVMKSFVRSECHSVQASKAGDELSFRSDKTKAVQALRELQRQMIGLLVPESTDRGNLRTKRDVHRLQSLLNKRKRLTRLKRQEFEQGDPVWDSPILNFIDSLFNSEQLGTLLEMAEMFITDLASADSIQGMKDLIDQVHNDVMRTLCRETTPQSEPERVESTTAEVKVEKTEFNDGNSQSFVFGQSQSSVLIGEALSRQFSEWDCDSDLKCNGLGLGFASFNKDILTPTLSHSNMTNHSLASMMYDLRILNPLTCIDLTASMQGQSWAEPLAFTFSVARDMADQVMQSKSRVKRAATQEDTSAPSVEFKCMVFKEDIEDWDASVCEMTGLTTNPDGTANVDCSCSIPGHTAVFLVQSDGTTHMLPEVAVYSKNIKIRMENDFNKTIGDKLEEFTKTLRKQLANVFHVTTYNIKDLMVKPGSILATFKLEGYDEPDKIDMAKNFESAFELFRFGKVKLEDHNGVSLSVPPQCIVGEACGEPNDEEKKVMIIAGAVVAALLLLAIIIIVIAIWKKNQPAEPKVVPVMGSSGSTIPPTYRSFAFAESLEGTKASMSKVKSPNYPPYLPSNYDSIRRQSDASLRVQEEEDSVDSGYDRRDSYSYSDPARYNKPSREDMQKTQPIPREIVDKVEQKMTQNLPGTPEH